MNGLGALGFALITALCFGAAPILARAGLVKVDPGLGLVVRTLTVCLALLGWLFISGRGGDLLKVEPRSLAFLAGEGVLAALIGHLAYFYALRAGEASQVVPVVSAFPVVAVILGVLFLGESPGVTRWAGVTLIVLGVILVRR